MMISNVCADKVMAMIDENHMRLMIEDSDKNVSEIWVYREWSPVCRFSLEKKEADIGWNRARALISANRRFDIEYGIFGLDARLIATSIRFRDDTPRKGSIVVTDKSTGGFESITGPMVMTSDGPSIVVPDKSPDGFEYIIGPMVMTSDGPIYGVHIIGSPNTLWTTLGTECWEYYKKPEIGVKRINSMQAVDILRKAANGEYKTYEIKFNYHIKESDSWRLMVDEVYIKYEEKDEEEDMARYAYRTFSMSHAACDWVNSKAEVSDKDGNTYSFDDSTDIYLRESSTDLNRKITFARAANVLLHNIPDSIRIGASIVASSRRITRMYVFCDEAANNMEEPLAETMDVKKLKEESKRLRDKIDKQKALLNSMYGVSALGWSDMWPTSMIDTDAKYVFIPPRSNGKMARLKELTKKYNLTVPECLYCMNDIAATKKIHDSEKEKENMKFFVPKIKKVLYNEPAVIVFWEDDTKTVVRAQDGEPYDKEKGLAMAISKKALGNDRDYYSTFIRYKAVPKPKKGKKKDKKE